MTMKTEVDMYGRRRLLMSAEEREEARKIREIERRRKTELELEVDMYGKTLVFAKMMRGGVKNKRFQSIKSKS